LAVETFPEVAEGALGEEAVVLMMIASEEIKPWVPVHLVAAGTGETMPRIDEADALTERVFGTSCGGEKYDPDATTPVCASVAGDKVLVVVFGRAKCKVNHTAGAIAIGDAINASATEEQAQIAAATGYPFAIALKASATDADIIPVFVNAPSLVVF